MLLKHKDVRPTHKEATTQKWQEFGTEKGLLQAMQGDAWLMP